MGENRYCRWEEMDKSQTDISVLIHHFEVHNRTEGKSPRTVEWYNQVLGMFYRWLTKEGLSTSLGSIREQEARRFVLYIQGKPGLKGATLALAGKCERGGKKDTLIRRILRWFRPSIWYLRDQDAEPI